MQAVTGVFKSRDDAEKAVDQLISLGLPEQKIGILSRALRRNGSRQVSRSPIRKILEWGRPWARQSEVRWALPVEPRWD